MQIYAKDTKNTIISAYKAQKRLNYSCLECGRPVRVRGGAHRQLHFFHLIPEKKCGLGQKSLIHLQVQLFFQEVLPGTVFLEKSFHSINRIADVVWETEKIVFEVQCSPISAQEVKERNRDYASLGYLVVWILHDKRYNRKYLSSAEHYLRSCPYYFTNINALGKGIIYDQFDSVESRVRVHKLPPLEIAVQGLKRDSMPSLTDILVIEKRAKMGVYFEGDLYDLWISHKKHAYFQKVKKFEKRYKTRKIACFEKIYLYVSRLLKAPFDMVLRWLLKKACR